MAPRFHVAIATPELPACDAHVNRSLLLLNRSISRSLLTPELRACDQGLEFAPSKYTRCALFIKRQSTVQKRPTTVSKETCYSVEVHKVRVVREVRLQAFNAIVQDKSTMPQRRVHTVTPVPGSGTRD